MGRLAAPAASRVQRFIQKVGTLTYASGSSAPVNVPQADYTTTLDIISNQQVVSGSTIPVIAAYGAFGPLALVQVSVNGARHPYAAPGYFSDIYMRVRSEPYASQMTVDPVTANTTTNWVNHLHIPLTLAEDTTNGAWYTGDTTLQMVVKIGFNTAAVVFSTVNSATIQGSWDVWRESFNAPPPNLSQSWLSAISWYHEIAQQGTWALKNGTTPIDLPRDQDYQRIFFNIYTGNDFDATYTPTSGLLTSVDLGINTKIHIFDTVTEGETLFQQVFCYAESLGAGWYVLDFERVKDSVRDILPTDTSVVQMLRLSIASTSSSNSVDVFTEAVVDSPFAAKWIQMAQQAAAAGSSGKS
jgi:hypothetical protein